MLLLVSVGWVFGYGLIVVRLIALRCLFDKCCYCWVWCRVACSLRVLWLFWLLVVCCVLIALLFVVILGDLFVVYLLIVVNSVVVYV